MRPGAADRPFDIPEQRLQGAKAFQNYRSGSQFSTHALSALSKSNARMLIPYLTGGAGANATHQHQAAVGGQQYLVGGSGGANALMDEQPNPEAISAESRTDQVE